LIFPSRNRYQNLQSKSCLLLARLNSVPPKSLEWAFHLGVCDVTCDGETNFHLKNNRSPTPLKIIVYFTQHYDVSFHSFQPRATLTRYNNKLKNETSKLHSRENPIVETRFCSFSFPLVGVCSGRKAAGICANIFGKINQVNHVQPYKTIAGRKAQLFKKFPPRFIPPILHSLNHWMRINFAVDSFEQLQASA
jgi:hypothetical protein